MKHKNKIVHYGVLGLIYGVAALTLVYHTVFHNTTHAQQGPACIFVGRTIALSVGDSSISPTRITARRCDVLQISNTGNKTHLMAMGQHENHTHYGTFEEGVLSPGQKISVALSQKGQYTLHDHLNNDLQTSLDIE